jgi:surfeit locus 1 family protein
MPVLEMSLRRRFRLRRFRPRLVWTLVMLVVALCFVTAGNWQRDRMRAKTVLRDQYEILAEIPPVPLPPTDDWSTERFRRVIVSGEYDAKHQILIDNRIRNGRAGYEVVTPMRLTDGRVVLLNRGWIPVGASRATPPNVPPPRGLVTVTGRIDLPSTRYVELTPDATKGALWQNLDPMRFAEATGLSVLPIVIDVTEAPVPDDGLTRAWPRPDFGIDTHRLYMLQWYALALLAVGVWLVLSWQ